MQLVDGADRLDDVRELIREYTEWFGRDLAFQDLEQELEDVGRKYLPPEGRVVVAVGDDGNALGCVAYHRLDGKTAEMKRLFVRPAGRALVLDSLARAEELGFRVMQFNAVVAGNARARHLYESLGFTQLGTIPGGFRMPDGSYADICPYYRELD